MMKLEFTLFVNLGVGVVFFRLSGLFTRFCGICSWSDFRHRGFAGYKFLSKDKETRSWKKKCRLDLRDQNPDRELEEYKRKYLPNKFVRLDISSLPINSNLLKITPFICRDGVIGSHAGLRSLCRKACEFESRPQHFHSIQLSQSDLGNRN